MIASGSFFCGSTPLSSLSYSSLPGPVSLQVLHLLA